MVRKIVTDRRFCLIMSKPEDKSEAEAEEFHFACAGCNAVLGDDLNSAKLHKCFEECTPIEVHPNEVTTESPLPEAAGSNGTGEPEEETGNDKSIRGAGFMVWTYAETLALIETYEKHIHDFANTAKRKIVWDIIADDLRCIGIKATPTQCHNKWKNLLKTYRTIMDDRRRDQKGPMKFRYFDRIRQVVGDMPSEKLVAKSLYIVETPLNLPPSALIPITTSNETLSDDTTVITVQSPTLLPTAEKSPKSSPEHPEEILSSKESSNKEKQDNDLISFVYEYFAKKEQLDKEKQEKKRQRYEERERQKEERHREKMLMEEKKLELLAKLLQK